MNIVWVTAVCPKCGSVDRFSIEESEYGETYVRCNKCRWYGEKHMLNQEVGRLKETRKEKKVHGK